MLRGLVFATVLVLFFLLSSSSASRIETDEEHGSRDDQTAKELSNTRRCFILCREFSNCIRCLLEKRRHDSVQLSPENFDDLTTPEPAAAKKRIMKLTASSNFRQPMRFGKRDKQELRQPMRFGKRELRQPMRFGKRELRQPMRFGKRELRQPMRFGKRELRQPMRFGKRDDDKKQSDPPAPFREPMRFGKRPVIESLEVASLFKPDYHRIARDLGDYPNGFDSASASLEADVSFLPSYY